MDKADELSVSSSNVLTPGGNVAVTVRTGSYHTYIKDIQGSTGSIVKEDGTLSTAYKYSDFGETEEVTGSSFNNEICYTGQVYDDETGLYYYNARYYDSVNGRFISQDMYRGETNDPGTWHLYAYCANDPINYVDPSGYYIVTTWEKSDKKVIYNHWSKPLTVWFKVKECKSITVSESKTINEHVSGEFGVSVQYISIKVGLDKKDSYKLSASATLKVNKRSKKKYVRAVLKADAVRWKIVRTKREYRRGVLIKTIVTNGYLYKYKKGSRSIELEYSNTKKK